MNTIKSGKRVIEISKNHGAVPAIAQIAYHLNIQSIHRFFLEKYWKFDMDFEPKVCEIPVEKIKYTHRFPFDLRGENAVIGVGEGQWDKMVVNFENTDLFKSIKQHFEHGVPWEKTPKYQNTKKMIEQGHTGWQRSSSIEELNKRCEYIEKLYKSIKHNGYESQYNKKWDQRIRGIAIPDDIRVAVNRQGEYIRLAGGRHRLAIAKILDIDKVTAILQICHRKYNRDQECSELNNYRG